MSSVVTLSQPGMDFEEFDRVRRAARSDQQAWDEEFGVSRDVSALEVERNVFRYRPAEVTIRLSEGEPLGHLVRLLAAAARTGAIIDVSTALPLPTPLVQSFDGFAPLVAVRSILVEPDARWLARAAAGEVRGRVRLVGGDARALADAVGWRSGYRDLVRTGHDGGPGRAAAVPPRAVGVDHRAPLRQPRPGHAGGRSLN